MIFERFFFFSELKVLKHSLLSTFPFLSQEEGINNQQVSVTVQSRRITKKWPEERAVGDACNTPLISLCSSHG